MITIKNRPAQKSDTSNEPQDVLLEEKPDRRLLSYVPDKDGMRSNHDRRGSVESDENGAIDYRLYQKEDKRGQRYLVDYEVTIDTGHKSIVAQAVDISTTGMLIKLFGKDKENIHEGDKVKLSFTITPGSMPEGYEMKIKRLQAHCVRLLNQDDGTVF